MAEFEYQESIQEEDKNGINFLFVSLYSLVLAFFILMFSYSTIAQKKVRETVDSVKSTFSTPGVGEMPDAMEQPPLGSELPLQAYYADIKKVALEEMQIDETQVIERGNTLIFRLPVYLFFKEGTAEVDDKRLFMEHMANDLVNNPVGKQLDVEFMLGRGRLPAPAEEAKKTAVHLSVMRAGAFARALVAMGVDENTIYSGLSEGDPDFFTLTFSPREEVE